MEIYSIDEIKKYCDDVKIFRLSPIKGKINYKAGHFLMLHLLDEKGESIDKRPYSIASSPTEDHIELAIKMVGGRFTSELDKMKEGALLGVEGPYGHFTYKEQEKCAFIAGGTGIAPFMGILRYINAQNKKGKFVLFYSCRKKDDILYADELTALSEKNPDINIVCFLTREEPEGWKGELGRIDTKRVQKYAANSEEYDWYICGPVKMTVSMKEILIGLGVPEGKISIEGWG